MKFKLNSLHLFIILLLVLLCGTCLGNIVEPYTSTTVDGAYGSATVYSGAGGNKAVAVDTNNYPNNYDYYGNGDSASIYGPAGGSVHTAQGPYGGRVTKYTGPYGGDAVVAHGPAGNTAVGVRKADIPPGDEDLYILKSEVVPPVCPKCPKYCERTEPCPACPPCARCPEPAFECKKVPNYTSNNDRYLPKPVLADFSTFAA